MSECTPATTYALVVGIEQYEASNIKDLNGQANDARKFVDWLRANGVPDSQILLFLSPIEANKGLLDQPGPAVQPATQARIRDAITKTLSAAQGSLLFIFWAGHGVLTADSARKLFYTDGTEKDLRALDLTALLTSLRSDMFPGFARQIGIIDSCANYVEGLGLPTSVPADIIPAGKPLNGHEQFVLLGAREGERAKSSAERQTGWFAEALLERLPTAIASPWPPDMKTLAEQLANYFSALRAAGKVNQTPAFFRYRDWDSSEVSFGQMAVAASAISLGAVAFQPLAFAARMALVNALLSCPPVTDTRKRNQIVDSLRPAIAHNIDRSDAAKFDVVAIVKTCENYGGGLEELIDIVAEFTGRETLSMAKLWQEASRILPGYEHS